MARFVVGLGLAFALAFPARALEPPRLVVVMVVDQLARYRISPSLPGGIGRLLREGRVFADATVDHGITETCPGHAVLLTGMNPGPAGIPGNQLFDGGRTVYCASDSPASPAPVDVSAALERAGTLGLPEGIPVDRAVERLRSPAHLRSDALGDRLPGKARKVFTVSGKDRAAIMLGGQRPTLAVWLDGLAGFTTSRWYAKTRPEWLARFDAERGLAPFAPEKLPERWSHPASDPRALRDDHPSESARYSRTSPHPVRSATREETVERLLRTPYADLLTLDLARTIVDAERLADGPGTNLLAVSLSATDYIGHAYGPDSQEAVAALEELDAQIGAFLAFLEARVARPSLLVVLTADHGVSQTPEVAAEFGTSECRAAVGGRVFGADMKRHVEEAVHGVCDVEVGPIAWDFNYAFKLAPAVWAAVERRCRKPKAVALAEMRKTLRRLPGVVEVWTAGELGPQAKDCHGTCRLERNSFAGERSGDLVVQLDPTCQLTEDTAGAGHGSPYGTDRAVPLVFWGGGVAPGVVRGRAHTVDLGPTLARRIGIPLDPRWNGSALSLE